MTDDEQLANSTRQASAEEDRYQDVETAIDLVVGHEDFPDGPAAKIEIYCVASGEVTWRVWTPGAVEPVGGHIQESG